MNQHVIKHDKYVSKRTFLRYSISFKAKRNNMCRKQTKMGRTTQTGKQNQGEETPSAEGHPPNKGNFRSVAISAQALSLEHMRRSVSRHDLVFPWDVELRLRWRRHRIRWFEWFWKLWRWWRWRVEWQSRTGIANQWSFDTCGSIGSTEANGNWCC